MVRETLANYFGFEEHNTDLRTEIIAGATTFLTMSYIVVVNPDILGLAITDVPGRTGSEVGQMLTVVTIITAALATLIMAFYANRPFAQAPGLGLNAFFAFTVVLGLGVPWQTALAAVVVEGFLFMLLTVAGAREYIIKIFPEPVKFAIGAGIGLFLAIIGLQAMHVIASDPATFIQFNPVFAEDPIAIISVVGLFLTFALYAARIPGSIIIGIILTTIISYAASLFGATAHAASFKHFNTPISLYEPASLTGDTAINYSMAGYDITPLVGAFIDGFGNVDALGFSLIVFTFFFVDFFDTAGTLTGVSQIAGFLDDEGNLPDIDRPLLSDAIGTTVGGMIGTSTVTTYIESSAGVEEGGRTGMTALVVALLFIGSLALVPLAAAVPLHASHIALVVVAVLMLQNITDIEWDNLAHSIPAGLTIFIMPFTFSIAYGIAAGIISYPIVKTAQGEFDDVHVGQWVLAGAFVLYFFVRTSGIIEGAL